MIKIGICDDDAGMHYENKKLEFVFVPTSKSGAGKQRQVLFSIDSSRVE